MSRLNGFIPLERAAEHASSAFLSISSVWSSSSCLPWVLRKWDLTQMISDPIGLASGLSIRPFRNHLFELAGGRRHGRRISDAIQADKTQKSGNEKQDCSKVFSKPKKVCT